MRETHQAIERSVVAREVNTLLSGDTKCVRVQGEPSDVDVILDDAASNVTRAVRDLERVLGVNKARRRLGPQERVVALSQLSSATRLGASE